ncbi:MULTISPECIES: PhoU domain-containing protein [Fusobacterium]|uniref:PhoU domain-containing protein n=2 Tax=Fusobacteriaceae TaxID=203492 RepID=UPI001F4F8795|nr:MULTISPECIES: PhoU domain-containing protein [Fusobacterium]MCI5724937.1 phosphate uptake regulator PhoU [Fusobacterium sp.]MCI7224233.1 phosphate uptake regulator PhoU [Fusobacterium sp.]MDY5305089.1 PhoU domain-containing protein [Fusobacterium gastrosuis]
MRNLDESIENINKNYIEVMKLLSYLIDLNKEAIKETNVEKVIEESQRVENMINSFEVIIKESSIIAIARYQPAAKNLRFFIMMINGARLLERMADLLKQNLKIILEIKEMDKNSIEYFDILVLRNIKIIENFYNKYVQAFIKEDEKIIYENIETDYIVNLESKKTEKKVLEFLKNEKILKKELLLFWDLNKKYERFSDHTVHLFSDLVYILNGDNLRRKELEMKKEI